MRTCVYLMGIFATLCCVAFGVAGYTQAQSASSSVSKNQKTMMHHAKGSFEPINTPQPPEDKAWIDACADVDEQEVSWQS